MLYFFTISSLYYEKIVFVNDELSIQLYWNVWYFVEYPKKIIIFHKNGRFY